MADSDSLHRADVTNYATLSSVLFCVFSLLSDDTDSQPIPRWHSVYSLTQDRINIHINFVGQIW
ncbi:hypothetical protein ACFL5F_06180 [Planctomycetota bacterium]